MNRIDSFHRLSQLGSVLSQLTMFMPWLENLTRLLSFGHLSIIADKVNGFKEIYQFMRKQIEKRANSWVKCQPRDITDAYLDKIEETTDVSSSFHKIRTTKKIKQFPYKKCDTDFLMTFLRQFSQK